MTFDDGPHPEVTPVILKILTKYKAKATFFCLGENVKLYPEVLENIQKEGHSIGIHGYSHINGLKCSVNRYLENIDLATQFINSNLFRPPYGKMRMKQYRWIKECFKIVLWDVMSYDFDPNIPVEKIVEKVCSKIKDGSIIVFHDSLKAKEKVLSTLPLVLERLKEYECCPIKII